MEVRAWIAETVGAPQDVAGVTPSELRAARERLTAAIAPLRPVFDAAGVDLPLALSNSTIDSLDRCVGLAIARAGEVERDPMWARLRGEALNAYVQHVLAVGPVGDPVEDLRSVWIAEERDDLVEALESFLDAANPRSQEPHRDPESDLGFLARSAAELAPLSAFAARTEQRVQVDIAGVVRLAGRLDVVVGGPSTGSPTSILEVKSVALRPEHTAQVRHYALLVALRDSALAGPVTDSSTVSVAAGVWAPGSGVTAVSVAGTLDSSAERIVAAATRIAALWSGDEPALNPGRHCRWCPAIDRCPEAQHEDLPPGEREAEDPWGA